MSGIATLIWIFNLLTDTVGQLSFKAAATHSDNKEGVARWIAMAKNHWIWIGLIAYVAEILLWLAFLSLVPLSMAVLLGSMNILCVMIGGRILFGERLNRRRIAAVVLIVGGVTMVGWS